MLRVTAQFVTTQILDGVKYRFENRRVFNQPDDTPQDEILKEIYRQIYKEFGLEVEISTVDVRLNSL